MLDENIVPFSPLILLRKILYMYLFRPQQVFPRGLPKILENEIQAKIYLVLLIPRKVVMIVGLDLL